MPQSHTWQPVNWEIFVVKKFSKSHKATKINFTKYFLQQFFFSTNPYHPCELLLVANMPVLLLVNICLELFGA